MIKWSAEENMNEEAKYQVALAGYSLKSFCTRWNVIEMNIWNWFMIIKQVYISLPILHFKKEWNTNINVANILDKNWVGCVATNFTHWNDQLVV